MASQHGNVELAAIVGHEQVVADEFPEAGPDLREVGFVGDVRIGVAVDLRRVG